MDKERERTLYWNLILRLSLTNGFLCWHSLNPEVKERAAISRWGLFKLGVRSITCALLGH